MNYTPYYTSIDGQVSGPYTDQQLSVLHSNSSISTETLICAEGCDDWKTFGELFGYAPDEPETESAPVIMQPASVTTQGTSITDIRIPFGSVLMMILKIWLAMFVAFLISWALLATLAASGVFLTDLLHFLLG